MAVADSADKLAAEADDLAVDVKDGVTGGVMALVGWAGKTLGPKLVANAQGLTIAAAIGGRAWLIKAMIADGFLSLLSVLSLKGLRRWVGTKFRGARRWLGTKWDDIVKWKKGKSGGKGKIRDKGELETKGGSETKGIVKTSEGDIRGATGNNYETKAMDSQFVGEETGIRWGGKKVKYLSEAERASMEVFVENGKLVDKAGKLLDTSSASSVFGGGEGKAIFVMDRNGRIFMSSFQKPGVFHHSSFLGGKPVAAAGEITISNGRLVGLTARSGHYRPSISLVNQAKAELGARGVDVSKIEITLGF